MDSNKVDFLIFQGILPTDLEKEIKAIDYTSPVTKINGMQIIVVVVVIIINYNHINSINNTLRLVLLADTHCRKLSEIISPKFLN